MYICSSLTWAFAVLTGYDYLINLFERPISLLLRWSISAILKSPYRICNYLLNFNNKSTISYDNEKKLKFNDVTTIHSINLEL